MGGFVGGGSTGHGALLHGGLSEDGAVLGLRVVTAESPAPRVLELRGRDVFPVVHAYGTNGVITSVELPLARAQPWTDVTLTFGTLAEAAACALDVANAPAIVKRAVTVFEAPIPHRASRLPPPSLRRAPHGPPLSPRPPPRVSAREVPRGGQAHARARHRVAREPRGGCAGLDPRD